MNHIVDRELGKINGKMFACFADIKGAFDKVDRDIMEERLEDLEISKRLRERVMETHEETMSMVKIGEKYSQVFWTKKGVRQGRPMSATPYSMRIWQTRKRK